MRHAHFKNPQYTVQYFGKLMTFISWSQFLARCQLLYIDIYIYTRAEGGGHLPPQRPKWRGGGAAPPRLVTDPLTNLRISLKTRLKLQEMMFPRLTNSKLSRRAMPPDPPRCSLRHPILKPFRRACIYLHVEQLTCDKKCALYSFNIAKIGIYHSLFLNNHNKQYTPDHIK